MERRDIGRYLIPVALAASVLLLYFRTGTYGLVYYDDAEYITRNPAVQDGLTVEGIRWAFRSFDLANWHPLTWLSHMLDVTIFGNELGRHHLVNVLFHLANTLLLNHLFRKMTGCTWKSGLVAALFALHPLHVESVAWLAERKDVLCAFWGFLSMIAYAGYASRPGAARYAAVLLFFVLGLMSKPMLVTLPFVLLLFDYWPLGRTDALPWPRLVLEKIPMFALSAASSIVTVMAQDSKQVVRSVVDIPLWSRAGNAVNAYAAYLYKTVWPSKLSIYYPHPMGGLSTADVALPGVVLAVISVLAIRQARTRRWLAVGWLFYLGTLVPVIGLVQVGGQAMADRYAYIPLIGLFVMAAWGGGDLAARWKVPAWGLALLAFAWLSALSACTWRQVGLWRGAVPLFTQALESTRDNYLAHAVLADAALDSENDREALFHFREVLRIRSAQADVHKRIGVELARQGRFEEAAAHFREVFRYRADDPATQALLGEALQKTEDAVRPEALSPEEHARAGMELAGAGRIGPALNHFRAAVSLRPDDPEAHYNLAVALGMVGRKTESIPHFREATRMRPGVALSDKKLGLSFARLGRNLEALRYFREASALAPEDPELQYNLGMTLSLLGRHGEAVPYLRAAVRSSGGRDADAMFALASALEASGETAEAQERYRDVLRLNPYSAPAMDRLERMLPPPRG